MVFGLGVGAAAAVGEAVSHVLSHKLHVISVPSINMSGDINVWLLVHESAAMAQCEKVLLPSKHAPVIVVSQVHSSSRRPATSRGPKKDSSDSQLFWDTEQREALVVP